MAFSTWTPADHCTGGAGAGAKVFMRWATTTFPTARNLGIYNCRSVRGGSSFSAHAEGRACDIGWPEQNGKGGPEGHSFVELLRPVASLMGIDAIIYDRTIWSAKSPGPAGRPYTGSADHYDHTHVELTRAAGAGLTLGTILAALHGSVPAPPVVAAPAVPVPVNLTTLLQRVHKTGLYDGRVKVALIAEGMGGYDVAAYRKWQESSHGGSYSGSAADGYAGRDSLSRLGARHGWTVVAP